MSTQPECTQNGGRVAVRGELGHGSLGKVTEAFERALASSSVLIELDFSDVTYIDSRGIAALYDLAAAVDGDRKLGITGVSRNVGRILHLSGLTVLEGVGINGEGAFQPPPALREPTGDGHRAGGPWSRSFPADFAALQDIRALVKQMAVVAGLSESRVFDLAVAVSEASANAIEHGQPGDGQASLGQEGDELMLSVALTPAKLTVTVSHPGDFRPRAQEDPGRFRRGMGLPLMLALMDEVTIGCTAGSGTSVSLSVLLPS